MVPSGAHPDPALAQKSIAVLDPRLQEGLRQALEAGPSPKAPLGEGCHWVIAGHRAAGKSRLRSVLAPFAGRPAVELDALIASRAGRELRGWLAEDPASFRRAERDTFSSLTIPSLISVGGGFLSLHPDLLQRHEVYLLPLTFETYRERLLEDRTRPRLRPELPLEEELRQVFDEREALHAKVRTLPILSLIAALSGERG